jgi:hypothetical protein
MQSPTRPSVNQAILDLIRHKQCLCQILDAEDATPEGTYEAIVQLASLTSTPPGKSLFR